MTGGREHDLVVFGATSFVGQIVCRRLVERVGTAGTVRWAIAGRSADKLDRVANDTGADVPRIVADATDHSAMRRLAESTAVVVSTVGPYAMYGSELVAAVARAGTDYCDLTGEPQWMRAMIDAHHGTAVASGARIVHACGFDSIPSDLGVWFTQREAIARAGEPWNRVGMRVWSIAGGVSGGTVASMLNLVDEARRDPALRRVLADPYALVPAGTARGPRQPNVMRPTHDRLTGGWVAPFVMAATNTKVVQRTHALLGRPWGDDFLYDEAMWVDGGLLGAVKAGAISATMGGLVVAAAVPPARWLVGRFVPKPGEGPSPAARSSGSFRLRFVGEVRDGSRSTVVEVTGDSDPGYGSTAKMLVEAALAFADVDHARVGGGFWTPASMFGDVLVDRLRRHAGITFATIGGHLVVNA